MTDQQVSDDSVTYVSAEYFDLLSESLDAPPEPNPKLAKGFSRLEALMVDGALDR